MKDSTLLWLALITGTLGVIFLLFLYQTAGLEPSALSGAKNMEEHDAVRVFATVESVRTVGNVTIITLEKKETIEAVVFDPLNLSEGMRIDVEGSISEYEGKRQITVESVTVLE